VELMYSVPVSRTCIDKLLGLIHIGADRHARVRYRGRSETVNDTAFKIQSLGPADEPRSALFQEHP
jgi:hypothetical protein